MQFIKRATFITANKLKMISHSIVSRYFPRNTFPLPVRIQILCAQQRKAMEKIPMVSEEKKIKSIEWEISFNGPISKFQNDIANDAQQESIQLNWASELCRQRA